MRQVMINTDRTVVVVEAADPVPPGPGGAVVTVDATSICGSDLHFYDGDLPLIAPLSIGHEFVGTVAAIGAEVRTIKVGDRVMCSCLAGCGQCDGCLAGDPATCASGVEVFGSGVLQGGQATSVAVPGADFQLRALPDSIDDDAALLLTDNLCTGWTGAKRANVPPGGTVVVLGLGAVGMCAVRSAVAQGAGQVLAADPVAGRRAMAAASGATPIEGPTIPAVMDATGGRGAHAVIDAVALDTTLDDAFGAVRAGGTVSVIGVHDLNPYPVPMLTALFRSITLTMNTAAVHQSWKELIPLVESGAIRTDGIVTHRFPLDAAAAAYALAAERRGDCLKVALQP
ncbi:MAG: alcohol dehydrogenase catalytic domain-containing protein [Frankiaceae bacterium]|nr:alcohol dehydrogenase catalytic domain-containing protein [Frankiaceae bacterium]MBV9870140.1 alcohol dehydrogenase catalytic domain-containing protein [Frankiaceae bacterium]